MKTIIILLLFVTFLPKVLPAQPAVTFNTISSSPTSFHNINYQWFDGSHNAPHFEIDSMINISGNTNKTMYLASPLAAPYFNAAQLSYTGYLANNQLHLTGIFENGLTYDLVIYSVIGSKIYNGDFTATGTTEHIDIGRDLNPGIYIVRLTQRSDPSFNQVIKVVKQ